MKTIVLTGGGTAGHVTPNIALIDRLREEGYEISYIGSKAGIEKELIENIGIPYYGISSGKLRRYFSMKNFTDPFRVLKGCREAKKLMKQLKPDVVFSKGGFVSVPVVRAAGKAKIPLVPVICVVCAIISLLSCIFIWLFSQKNKQPLPPLTVEKAPAVRYQSVTVVTEKPEPVDAALIDRISSTSLAKEDSIVIIDAPVVIPAPASRTASAKDTKDYQIKWGDTLWDIADTFYKNPWMYDKIAKANNIKNPDFILSGTWIKIPPL